MTATPEPVARLQGVTHRYGKVVALADLTLDLPAGRMVGLIGPDGVGKSTLMGLIAGAKRLQEGSVTCLGASTRLRYMTLPLSIGRQDAGSRLSIGEMRGLRIGGIFLYSCGLRGHPPAFPGEPRCPSISR